MGFVSSNSCWPKLSVQCQQILRSSDRFWAIRGPRGPKSQFFKVSEFYIFHPIFMGFVSVDSFWPKLLVEWWQISRTSYRFRAIRGRRGPISHFFKVPQVFISHQIFMGFVIMDSSWPKRWVGYRRILLSINCFQAIRCQRLQ